MNGAKWLVQSLIQRGVEYIFVLCGNGLQPFLEACHGSGLNVIDVRNEQAASYMADLWGRMTGRLGVVAVSSGPGHTNALTGLANAAWDGGQCSFSAAAAIGRLKDSITFRSWTKSAWLSPSASMPVW